MTTTTTRRRKKKRIMRNFKIAELSAVDRPAQEHATMALMKREDPMNTAQDVYDKALSGVPERHRPSYEEARKATAKAGATKAGRQPASFATFEEAVQHLKKLHGLSGTRAMEQAAREHPSLLAKYNEAGEEAVAKAADNARPRGRPKEVQDFDLIVEGIRARDKVSRRVAMERARRENPEAFRAMQEA